METIRSFRPLGLYTTELDEVLQFLRGNLEHGACLFQLKSLAGLLLERVSRNANQCALEAHARIQRVQREAQGRESELCRLHLQNRPKNEPMKLAVPFRTLGEQIEERMSRADLYKDLPHGRKRAF